MQHKIRLFAHKSQHLLFDGPQTKASVLPNARPKLQFEHLTQTLSGFYQPKENPDSFTALRALGHQRLLGLNLMCFDAMSDLSSGSVKWPESEDVWVFWAATNHKKSKECELFLRLITAAGSVHLKAQVQNLTCFLFYATMQNVSFLKTTKNNCKQVHGSGIQ